MIYSKSSIKNIAESIGIPKLKDGISTAMAQDVEYRLHEIITEGMKFMRHSKRTKLTVADVNSALRVRNIEPMYGFEAGRPIKFHKAASALEDIYYVEDEEIDLNTILEEPLPSVPLEVVYTAHWLAIEGVQPRIQQNPIPLDADAEENGPSVKKLAKTHHKGQDGVETIPLVKHVLSKELQLYFECITESLQSTDPIVKSTALESISVDAGIHQLVTYFVQYVAVTVKSNLHNLESLRTAMAVAKAIRRNPNLFVEPYMHQLIPSLLTCLVSKRLCDEYTEDHWSLRDNAAEQIADICQHYGHSYHTLQSRIARTLLRAFLDPTKPLTTHYGAIVGLTKLGASTAKVLILPNIKTYMTLLSTELEKNNPQLTHDGKHCQEALLEALRVVAREESAAAEDELKLASLSSTQKNKLSAVLGEAMAEIVLAEKHDGKIVAGVLAIGNDNKASDKRIMS
ncbi:histone H4-like TAF Taf6, SAGA complex subunit [Coemansia sp. RSA 1813]|nr:histone H4-like TAF Taf6, SAGA complex subunit [Coemansia sp. RSA 1646]KAJ1771128.1 histone H4-like TAF Taf6, SAGA complex subunit [Coemansia sp. RSA 1843]KAJ2088482.1 histone H4-like TAF Taf6, SAGA complex subunit [Coemansia sp. RSA 986]KAJ2217075.1 histone H4-like TAF Taf6, SAGA complex subunit [Coemansia sp. RSA 487]KAJ2568287.1 histone H4-like TAF Taf6, SAGA complex subunit [Coemansia sp. RSA 1813]